MPYLKPMSWLGIEGHDQVVAQFRQALVQKRLASTFLFVGPPGIGKRSFAQRLAQALLCEGHADEELDACGTCESCVQVNSGSHPDLIRVAKPADRASLPLSLLIGEKEHRMREGLCYELGLKPMLGGRKVAIIDDADTLGIEGANCLLKTLEEPPPKSLLILIGTTPERQLPTIRSRSQMVRFQPLAVEVVEQLLVSQGMIEDPAEAARVAPYCEGSLAKAAELADADLWEFRRRLYEHLSHPKHGGVAFAQSLAGFVDQAGKEAALRRNRLRQVLTFAADFFRSQLRALCGAATGSDAELNAAVQSALAGAREDQVAASLERCVTALAEVDRNANQGTLIECWLDDLAQPQALVAR